LLNARKKVKRPVTWLFLLSAPALLAWLAPAEGQTPTSGSLRLREDLAIEPGSIISGFVSPPAYTVSRYDEDYRFLADPANRTEALDALKYLPLFGRAPEYFLTLGGELREQYEYILNDNFGVGSKNGRGYWLQRLMLHSDWHFGPFVRAFTQFKSNLEEGREPGPRPPDRKRLDLNQAFVDFSYPRTNLSGDTASFTLRLGRQEVDFGDERLIAVREGANARQSFDGARLIFNSPKARVDAFALRLDADRAGYFNNDPSWSRQTLWGVYASVPLTTKSTASALNNIALDLFYLGFNRGGARFNAGVGDETRHTVGGRLWRAHHINGLDFNVFGTYQFGSFDNKEIRAFSAALDLGYKLQEVPWAPRVACSLQVSSGDVNPKGKQLNTFNALFPAGYYYGGGLIGQIGPANAIILQPELDLHPTATLGVYLKGLFVWREDTADGLYNTPGGLIRPGSTNPKRYVGASPEILVTQQLGRHAIFSVSYYHFYRGGFLTQNQPASQDVDYFSAWLTYKF
jgi:hypothetical protein